MRVLNKSECPGRVHVKSWCEEIEHSALDQVINLAILPFAYHHVAIMPDCHCGMGMPIGGVLATKNVIIPNSIGSDIGCGVLAMKTSILETSPEKLKMILGKIREVIPVGFNHHKEDQLQTLMPTKLYRLDMGNSNVPICCREYRSALRQLGTLGGGNHFIEFQKDSQGYIWIMIHSGSRNLGKKIGDHYNKLAKELNEKWFSQVPKEWDLAFFPVGTEEAGNYLAEMKYALDFAKANRQLMMDRIIEILSTVFSNFAVQGFYDVHHNYARIENHFGQNVWVHRKGATSAREGEIGIIPGSQGTKSYIVRGLGNRDSFMSCSHGAGRTMSRTKARNELNLEDEIAKLDAQDIIHSIRNQSDLDEAPSSYKDIIEVMEAQKDLVEIVEELSPIAVIKG